MVFSSPRDTLCNAGYTAFWIFYITCTTFKTKVGSCCIYYLVTCIFHLTVYYEHLSMTININSTTSFLKKNKFIYLFFWLCLVFVAARGLSLVAASRGYSSLLCVGFSLRWLLLLWSTGCR